MASNSSLHSRSLASVALLSQLSMRDRRIFSGQLTRSPVGSVFHSVRCTCSGWSGADTATAASRESRQSPSGQDTAPRIVMTNRPQISSRASTLNLQLSSSRVCTTTNSFIPNKSISQTILEVVTVKLISLLKSNEW